jgi:hypothetical protein
MLERAELVESEFETIADEAAWRAYVDVAYVPRPGQITRTTLMTLFAVGLVAIVFILVGTI